MPLAALLCAASTAAARSAQPSFLFMLGDDIGWGDVSWNNGTARTTRLEAWGKRDGSIIMQDGHSGGTVCSPTRATILTGRNHFRDCVNYVYGCSDMTECDPDFPFAQQRTFTFPDAVRKSGKGYKSWFGGKWHLGSFFNDTKTPSSPIFHGFDHMNATVEVAPTGTLNCDCREDWSKQCDFGHYHKPTHCAGGANPGGPDLQKGCCFNYWWEDTTAPHAITNLTQFSGVDDSVYLAEAFALFLESRKGDPFAAQISFHNCHIPFIGTNASRQSCVDGKTCQASDGHGGRVAANYTDAELDFYACMTELDASVGRVLDTVERLGYYDNTLIWFTTDNGPEGNCQPEGFCQSSHYDTWPGDSGLLRGRKRDIWEGGHRVPTVISWPAMVKGPARVSWDLVVTMDFLATIMDVLGVERPASQRDWAFDGKSILPILRGEPWEDRGVGWMYHDYKETAPQGFRFGKWKYVKGSTSCSNADCKKELLYDLSVDLGEKNDISAQHPDILAALRANMTAWYASLGHSRAAESKCPGSAPAPPVVPSTDCEWATDTGLSGADMAKIAVSSKEECCGACRATSGCVAADFNSLRTSVPPAEGVYTMEDLARGTIVTECHLKSDFQPITRHDGSVACRPTKKQ
eukprot:TRINITY_DN60095_c0_g1_i1.p2 TRINITY_DN60095_c0_g1~~TRINITY_DN60095_c0_g1_i1.p2  ORF type:complete len:665 (+),score=191.16 TRINITY_DN60095_c0_g1_i1:96-1997(+)